jgi:hypothetical protein
VSWEHVKGARGRSTGAAQAVLMVLGSYADDDGRAWPSVATICRDAGIGRATVQRALRKLVAANLITLLEAATTSHKSAVYRLLLTRIAVIPATGIRTRRAARLNLAANSSQSGGQLVSGRGPIPSENPSESKSAASPSPAKAGSAAAGARGDAQAGRAKLGELIRSIRERPLRPSGRSRA